MWFESQVHESTFLYMAEGTIYLCNVHRSNMWKAQAVALRFFESSKLSRISLGKDVHHFQLRTSVNQICKTWWSWAGNHVLLGPPGTDPAARNISLDGGLLNITPRSKNRNTWNEISISNCLRHPETDRISSPGRTCRETDYNKQISPCFSDIY